MCSIHSEVKQTESQSLEQRNIYCRAMQGDRVVCALKSLELPEGFWQSAFKSQVRHLENELIVAREEVWGKEVVWNWHVHTLIFKMDNQQGPAVQHRELCLPLYGSLDGRGVWGRMPSCICMAESLRCLSETTTTLLITYTSIQNAVLKKEI